MQVSTAVSELTPKLAFSEILSFAYDTFCSNKVRFMLTALGMVIGTASLILVVTMPTQIWGCYTGIDTIAKWQNRSYRKHWQLPRTAPRR